MAKKIINEYFKEVNLNPKGKKTCDCVIRAISNAEKRDWYDVFDELTKLARKECSVINDPDVYGKYLDGKYETIKVKYIDKHGEKRRLRPFNFREHNLKGTYIVSVAGHLTCVRAYRVEDTWFCGQKAAYKIWKIK